MSNRKTAIPYAWIALLTLVMLAGICLWLYTPDIDRAALERTYLTRRNDMMSIAGDRLHVRDAGPRDAPALILIHGFGASLQTWDAWAEALQTDHRVIRFDLPGSGLSEPDVAGDYTDARSLQLLTALQDRLGLARATIVGHSIGGRIAWTFAARHPARVDRLILVAPDGFSSPGFRYGQAPKVPVLFELMRYTLPQFVLRMNLVPAYADPTVLSDARVKRYRDLILAPGARDAMLARMRQTVLVDPVPLLETIRAPTLLIWGEQDRLIPFTNSADYLRTIRGARLVALPGVSHLPQEEAPALSAAAVREFLTAR